VTSGDGVRRDEAEPSKDRKQQSIIAICFVCVVNAGKITRLLIPSGFRDKQGLGCVRFTSSST
jgi:hypothetical protein